MTQPRGSSKLPEGAVCIGAGLCVLGVTVYGFLAVSARAMGPERYAALSALWALVFLIGPGVFFPVEQELSRAVAARRCAGVGTGPVVRRAALAAAGLAAVLTLLAGAFRTSLLDELFDGEPLVLAGLVLSLFGYASMHVIRGVLSGNGDFPLYSLLIGSEGVVRLAVAGVLVGLGVRTAGPFGLVVGLAPFLALGMGIPRRADLLGPGPEAPWQEVSRSLGFLLAGSVLAQVLIHGGPVAVKLLAGEESTEATGAFFAGLLLTRVPLFLFLAVQAPLLPVLATFSERGDRARFCATLAKLLWITAFVGVVSVAGAFFFGRAAVEMLFGPGFALNAGGLALLATSSAGIMAAQALAQSMIALGRNPVVALCWLIGVIVFLVITAIPEDVLLRVELGLAAGSWGTVVAMAVAVRTCLASDERFRRRPGSSSSLPVPPL